MPGITGELTGKLVQKLRAQDDGMHARLGAMVLADRELKDVAAPSIHATHASVALMEKVPQVQYPALFVYCEKLSNSLGEKFRRLSGRAHLVIDVRCTHDRLDGVETGTQLLVDAACALLDDARGDWGQGAHYGGGYEVSYEPVGRGGKNFLQRALIGFDIEISR